MGLAAVGSSGGEGIYTGCPYTFLTENRFDPAKDTANQHKLSLAFGGRIFEGDNHLILPTIRAEDEEDRFKMVGLVGEKLFYRRVRMAGRSASPHFREKEQPK